MTEAERLSECISHVITNLEPKLTDRLHGENKKYLNEVILMCKLVLGGRTTEDAIKQIKEKNG